MRYLLWATTVVLVLDQAIKWWVIQVLDLKTVFAIDVLPPFLNLRMAWNRGINFGLFAGDDNGTRWTLIALALAIVVFVLWWIWRDRPGRLGMISAGILIGGAFGNVIDRVVYGAVADFINMSCCGLTNPFAFNLADIAIFVGAVGLVVFADGKKPA
ncbi:MAG: signal peptidase II [Rhodobacteraceae bacterium]|nr:signal peptidase II [Paracoccaceae bacterium]